MNNQPPSQIDHDVLAQVNKLLQKHKLVEDVVQRQEMQRHHLVETLVHKQNLAELNSLLEQMNASTLAKLIEVLPEENRNFIWDLLRDERKEGILLVLDDAVRVELVADYRPTENTNTFRVFEIYEGRFRQIPIASREELIKAKPIWIDIVAPEEPQIALIKKIFGVNLPSPRDLTDLYTGARFYEEENGEVHLHSNFLLDREDESRNVPVGFVLHKGILFSVRNDELPVFRLQRLRAKAQSVIISDAKDVLLDLYAADVEYSSNALEDVYAKLAEIGRQVYKSHISDDDASVILSAISEEEDLNGRVRGNVLDTRRALSFMLRAKILSHPQHEEVREILLDIESLDGHTTFLFTKINFLMDATDSSININQNKDIKRLTVLSVVFMPLNVIAGIGGMSEYSMMTQGTSWPIAYGIFSISLVFIGWLTFVGLRMLERHKINKARKSKIR
ncbi:MAG: Mg2 transporter protein CorA family protein [Gallionellaceae bacterium]|nr:MAG: Mg2 transporter protein CorA family protein [Gallionellaceae bacterium]